MSGAWRRLLVRSALLPAAVLAPLSTLALGGDHRFNVYWHGATVVDRPWTLVTANLRTVPMYLDFGNFRPLGRMLEWALDLTAYVLMAVLHLPAETAMRAVAAFAAAVLTAAVALFAEAVTARGRMFAAPPAAPVALLPLVLAGCLVAAGPLSTTVLFGGLYYLSTALVLAVAAWIARGPRRLWPVVLAGAALAAGNEIGALGLLLATVVAVIRTRSAAGSTSGPRSCSPAESRPRIGLWTSAEKCRTQLVDSPHPVPGWGPDRAESGWRGVDRAESGWRGAGWQKSGWRGIGWASSGWRKFGCRMFGWCGAGRCGADRAGLRSAAALWLGFLPVFLPARILIALACQGGACYRASDVALGPAAVIALPDRLAAWLPPVQWVAALRGAGTPSRLAVLVALLVFGLVGVRLVAETRRLPRLDRRSAAALATAGLTVLVLGALLGSASPQPQAAIAAGHWGQGWRDSGLTAAGGALVVAALLGRLAPGRLAPGRLAPGRLAPDRLAPDRLAPDRLARDESGPFGTTPGRWGSGGLVVPVLALVAAGSAVANGAYAATANRTPAAQLDNAIAAQVAQFDDSPAGRARRCALAGDFGHVFPAGGYSRFARGELPGTHSPADRLERTASMATEQMYGQPFCGTAPR